MQTHKYIGTIRRGVSVGDKNAKVVVEGNEVGEADRSSGRTLDNKNFEINLVNSF